MSVAAGGVILALSGPLNTQTTGRTMRQWETVSTPENPFKTKMRISSNGSLEVEYDQTNMSEVLDVNVALQNADSHTSSLWNDREAVHVARIPEEVIHQWHREGINFYRWNEQDRARVMAKLNDGDFAKLRTDDASLVI